MDVRPWPRTVAREPLLHNTPSTGPNRGISQNKANVSEPPVEFDEYGTELHRDARVWKVYVQETDKYDAELVKVWNDSTDVILIFAALFSAISTAFLIESSKMLQPDPANISSRTLSIISQTLLTLANGSQPVGSVAQPAVDSAEFVPSRTAICVNTLWYLSLSLSLATSFIAILSKDWCHSFMNGRTGHHYTQTCRRQRKWDALERWKMAELLAVLPSMIHVALLLFSVGLCILLWDLHGLVAIPVICISGVAFGFYAWSSVAAIVLDFFPYPTIVSRLCRTKPAQMTFTFMYQVVTEVVVPLAVRSIYPLAWCMIYLGARPLEFVVDHLIPIFEWLSQLDTTQNSVRAFVCGPAQKAQDWLERRGLHQNYTTNWIHSWFPIPKRRPKWTKLETKNINSGDSRDLGTGELAGLALSWLITNCEVPQSVDIALQAIAGATNRMSPQPLLECQAPLQILRRLASSNLYRRPDTKSEAVEALYLRALSFLKASTNQTREHQINMGAEHQALIWDLQLEVERKLRTLIETGDFDPTRSNLEALRLGSTVASTSQKILRKELRNADIKKILDSIIKLLKSHLDRAHVLHDAALLSLAHAAILTLLLTPLSFTSRQPILDSLPETSISSENDPELTGEQEAGHGLIDALATIMLCFHLTSNNRYSKLVTGLSATCKFLFNAWISQMQINQPYDLTWYEAALRRLVEEYAQGRMALEWVDDTTTSEMYGPKQAFDSASYLSRLQTNFLAHYHTPNPLTLPTAGTQPREQAVPSFREDSASSVLYAVLAISCLGPVTVPSPVPFVSVVEVMCRTPPSSPLFAYGARLLSNCPFPTLSDELATALEQRDLVRLLETTSTSDNRTKQYFAMGQLWLLLSLYIYAGDTASGRDKLKVELDKWREDGGESEQDRYWRLCYELWASVSPGSTLARDLGVWAWRLEECVRQSLGYYGRRYLDDALGDVPPGFRRLSSFTAWPRRADDPPANELQRAEEVVVEVGEGADVVESSTQGEDAAGGDAHVEGAGLPADVGKARTLEAGDTGKAGASENIVATALVPMDEAAESVSVSTHQGTTNEGQNEANDGTQAAGDGQSVAGTGNTEDATGGLQSEGEEPENGNAGQGGSNEGDVVIPMDRLEEQSSGSAPNV